MTNKIKSLDLYSTADLTIFQYLVGNRETNKSQINRLAKVVADNPLFNYLNPVIVNEKMEVIDGQHRIAAFQKFRDGLGDMTRVIYYLIYPGLSLSDARAINAGSKPWRPIDYAKAYAHDGNRNYKIYLEFINLYKLNHDVTARFLVLDGIYTLNSFRDGEFKVKDATLSHKICEELSEVGELYQTITNYGDYSWKNRNFALAFLDVAVHALYSHKRMMDQMKSHVRLLKNTPLTVTEMKATLRQIYNKGQDNKVDLADN